VTVTYNDKTLSEGTDYSVKYTSNINAGTAKATVTGKGNYSGTRYLEYTINKRSIDDDQKDIVSAQSVTVVSGQTPKVTLIYNGKTLSTKDYSASYFYDDGSSVKNGKFTQSGRIELTGKGNFTGTRTITVSIAEPSQMKKLAVTLVDTKYSVTYTGEELSMPKDNYIVTTAKTDEEVDETDYIVTYYNNIKVGTAKVTFTGIGYYTGSSVTKTFKITPATSGITEVSKPDQKTYSYNPSGVTIGSDIVLTYNGKTLTENTDYKIKYTNNKKAGENIASYKVTFLGNFKGYAPISGSFSIDYPNLGDTEIVKAVSADKIYNKPNVYKSAPTVTYNGTTVKASEYTVKYYHDKACEREITKLDPVSIEDDIDYATVYVKIKGKGTIYQGEYYTQYKVWKSTADTIDLSKARITFTGETKNKVGYKGYALTPSIKIEIKSGNKYIPVENPETYFDIDYYNNINQGKATVVVKAKENLKNADGKAYIGSKSANFTITKKTITSKK
jgi:hypothetical protein